METRYNNVTRLQGNVPKVKNTRLVLWELFRLFGYYTVETLNITTNELRHNKTNKMSVRLAKTQISLGICLVWSESSLFAWRNLGSLRSYSLSALQRLWSDWGDAQADLSFCWAHTHFVGFVMVWIKSKIFYFFENSTSETGRMPRLIWVFAGGRVILFVLSCRGWVRSDQASSCQSCDFLFRPGFCCQGLFRVKQSV